MSDEREEMNLYGFKLHKGSITDAYKFRFWFTEEHRFINIYDMTKKRNVFKDIMFDAKPTLPKFRNINYWHQEIIENVE